ncbi:cation:proton antiporter [Idiomarina loihiensis]|uniref:cation:proton antiporter domain-containing protein n=1 Tax=Idiomarina loihiensis TaxID=135577 RepID=UPI00315832CA
MTDILVIATLFLIAGVIAVPIASKLGLGSVLGYLLAGIAISPLLSALHVDVESIQHVAEFGVVMMLFIVGLELEPKVLWSMRKQLIGLGGGQVLLTSAILTGIGILLGFSWQLSLVCGLILSLSSTAIVLQTLSEKGLMKSDGGKASFSVLLTQDIVVIPMLAIIPLLVAPEMLALGNNVVAEGSNGHSQALSLVAGLASWQSGLVMLTAVVAVVLGGIYLSKPIFRFVASARLRELLTATALLFVFAIAALMSLVELSPALGTFLAGVVLANSPYKHELESNIEPFKGLLLGLFFITVGASINFSLLADSFQTVLMMTLGLMLVKAVVVFTLGKLFKVKGAENWLMALGLAQAGEFGFVLLAFSVARGVLPPSIADSLLLVVTLSMALSPLLFIVQQKLIAPRYIAGGDEEPQTSLPNDKKIIIAGSGRVGGLVDRILRVGGFETTVIDYNYKQLESMSKLGFKYFYGDATRPDLLHAAGIEQASLLIVALDEEEQITKLVRYARDNYPHIHVTARAVHRHHVYDLYYYGCRDIIRETYDSSLRIGRSALEALGIKKDTATDIVNAFDEYDKQLMRSMADVYKVGMPFDENPEYLREVKSRIEQISPELERKVDFLLKEKNVQ